MNRTAVSYLYFMNRKSRGEWTDLGWRRIKVVVNCPGGDMSVGELSAQGGDVTGSGTKKAEWEY